MQFEYDPDKSAENKRKHGVDFEEAQALWADPGLVEIPARTSDEPRWLLIGQIGENHCSAVLTRRGENIRLISVRRSRDEEVRIYESEDIGPQV
ncbi:MAG TPA: BrnT family toxin [Candidatus Dormibacteraeota bacterium]|nr:BrnT family toxin [Candidatus Dormibacteraeota bacterium]